MPIVFIDCPHCGYDAKLDESFLNKQVKCPKCKQSFKAELGGTYDLAAPPPRNPHPFGEETEDANDALDGADDDDATSFEAEPQPQPKPKPKAKKSSPPPQKKIDPDLEARFDAWASDDD
jgi:hypothetical protein